MRAAACFLISLLFFSTSARATTYVVTPDGTGDFPTIQAAIDAVVDGDIVELTDGTFAGKGNRDVDFLGKAITLRSQTGNPVACTIDCEGQGRGFNLASGEKAGSVLLAVTIANGYAMNGGAVRCSYSSPQLRNCVFVDNVAYAGHGGGVYLRNSSALLFACTFCRNVAVFGGGLLCFDCQSAEVVNCTFAENEGSYGGGIDSWDSAMHLENTIVAFNTGGGGGLFCEGSGSADLVCCDVYGNSYGDWVGCIADQYAVDGNICEDPLFCNLGEGNLHLREDSPCAPFSDPNPECDLIGAWPVGCAPADIPEFEPPDDQATVSRTWGGIKAMFRK